MNQPMRSITLPFLLILVPFLVHSQITMEKNTDGILVKENGQPVLLYHTMPKSMEGQYERTNYIHPLWNVDGTVLTEDFPEDHPHQRGIYWAWHQIWIDSNRIGDGWALLHYDQKVVDTDWQTHLDGSATLTTLVNWKSDLYTRDGHATPYIEEKTMMTIHPKVDNYRRIDFEIRLSALVAPVAIGGSEDEKGYSGFSIRMKLPEDLRFTGPNGDLVPQVNAIESPGYVDISATFDNSHPGGIIIFDHPDNPGYPQPWILREKKSMQNVKYPGREPVTIPLSEPLVLKYSLVSYTGKQPGKIIESIDR